MDTTEYALALARAQADLVSAQARYQEMTLFDDEITDPAVREERARLTRAGADSHRRKWLYRKPSSTFERTTVRAPFEGRVADLRVVEGQHVGPGTELMTVVDLDPIKVEAQVLDPQIGFLSEGRKATVTFAAFPGETFTGRVASINPVVDPEFRTSRVTVLLSNPNGRIKPGMYARVVPGGRVLSPTGSWFPGAPSWRRTAGHALRLRRRQGEVALRDHGAGSDDQVEIVPNEETSMVEPGEMVLMDNHYYLEHDAPVQVVDTVTAGSLGGGQ